MKRSGSALFDGDAAGSSELARAARSRTTVADADGAYRAELLTEYLRVQGDLAREIELLAHAQRYDNAHPTEEPLVAELVAAVEGDQYEVAA
ncbi:hypothetical protein [Streptomyces sp. NBRC 109706]|uniref:hypothetical protein n=1 Tax=Streptomyces sp. NBRC 109706 TaxID=1550035 RepID=UPI0007811E1A|nr:hypothetical protein [Streptomyces sp. NBRC 109706]